MPSAEVIGEVEIDGMSLRRGVAGEIKGTDYLFLADLTQIIILDISNPAVPREISRIDVPRQLPGFRYRAWDIELSETTLYIPLFTTSNEGGLWLVDVNNPLSPQEITMLPLESTPMDIAISDNLACIVIAPPEGFLFFDISDPQDPRLVNDSISPFPERLTIPPNRVQLVDSMLYVLGANGLVILDITDPASPKEISFYANPNWDTQWTEGIAVTEYQPEGFIDFAVSGQYAYITSAECGLRVLSIADPAAPYEAAHLDIPNRVVTTVLVADNLVYLLERNLEVKTVENPSPHAIRIVDITNPLNPIVADIVENFADYASSGIIIEEGNHIYFPCLKTLYVIEVYGGK
jgi:hypothetical protein